ncbi:hypothetical protein KIW84_032549 [Lathyrus oleraceus]|uniref:Uncharacterized protein n=1 Tax=Pisum sativum TaxID=3888 RepID=A0A9D4XV67_PEA|nr:hypothetical protein KIW84_032549 [Pisum sativum]
MKRAFDQKVRPRSYQIGDLVLKRILPPGADNRGKWTPNYEGPYVVKKVFSGGALMLTTMDGEDFPSPVNSDAKEGLKRRLQSELSVLHQALSAISKDVIRPVILLRKQGVGRKTDDLIGTCEDVSSADIFPKQVWKLSELCSPAETSVDSAFYSPTDLRIAYPQQACICRFPPRVRQTH